MKNQIISLWWK